MKTKTQEFIQKFNEAFATNDIRFIEESVTDDVVWIMKGDTVINGKSEMVETLNNMDNGGSFELTIDHIITHGKTAAANGTMKVINSTGEDGAIYAFCDIYKLSSSKDGKIKELTSYLIEEK
ncbi:nuclear transport factor 2 family protein [Salipaludibacillus sp. HK11]|uniref:nuclear transport factor 2 family protein n=1 Tax=Salipaludibacillus sp. HK11 TaxID=3394320 RepID=UPI0039FD4FC2